MREKGFSVERGGRREQLFLQLDSLIEKGKRSGSFGKAWEIANVIGREFSDFVGSANQKVTEGMRAIGGEGRFKKSKNKR